MSEKIGKHMLQFSHKIFNEKLLYWSVDYILILYFFSGFYLGGHIGPTHEIHLKVVFAKFYG